MRITETKLRSIIRSVIKESMLDSDAAEVIELARQSGISPGELWPDSHTGTIILRDWDGTVEFRREMIAQGYLRLDIDGPGADDEFAELRALESRFAHGENVDAELDRLLRYYDVYLVPTRKWRAVEAALKDMGA